MGSMFPALDIKQPTPPLEQFAQAQQIVGQRQNQQLQALQIQEQTRALQDQDAATRAMANWDGKSYDQLPTLVKQAGGSANAVMGMTKGIFALKQQASEVAKNDSITNQNQVDTAVKTNDQYRGRLLNIVQQTDPAAKQAQWDSEVSKEEAAGTIQPGQISHTYPGDGPATAFANHFALGSTLVKEADDKQRLAIDAWKPSGGLLVNAVTGEKIGGINNTNLPLLNQGLATRYQVLNPGKPVPDYFQLQPGAAPADFDRIDKLLEGTEKAKGTVEQQATTRAIRAQTFEMMTEKQGLKPVIGTNPQTGQTVAVPYSQAQQMGIKDAAEMPATEYSKTLSARQWLTLAKTQAPTGAPSSDMGISQLLDKMDKAGKLGPLAGRWNEFTSGTWGAGDADYSAFKTKLDLSNTLLANVHTGRLGPYLMENLASLAQAKKMDGPTLRSAFNSEISYVKDRAMDPNPPNYGGTAPGKGNTPQTGAAALPQGSGKVIDKATAQQFYQAAGNDPAKARALATQNGWKVPQVQQ